MMEGCDGEDNVGQLPEYQIKEEPADERGDCAVNDSERFRSESLASEPSVPLSSEASNRTKPFHYQKQCVICGEDASAQAHSPESDEPVYLVRERTAETLHRAALDYDGQYIGIEEVRQRLNKDLVALNARYHKSCHTKLLQPHNHSQGRKRGRSSSEGESTLMRTVYEYIEKNREDSQYSLEDIRKYTNVTLDDDTLMSQLTEHYHIAYMDEKKFVITQKEFILKDWYDQAKSEENIERSRIVSAAANIILEDIRAIPFDNEYYPPPSEFLDDVVSKIPKTLRTFIETLVLKYRDDPAGIDKTAGVVAALTHAIMTAARPRTFNSPLLLGIGSYVHQKYASKSLINLLSSLGFCASYSEVMKFEMSLAYHDKPKTEAAFTQFVYDSLVTQTEGYSGPALVGVQCDTPKQADAPVLRLDEAPPGAAAAPSDVAILQMFVDPPTGLKNVLIEDHNDDTAVLPTKGDAMWLFGKNDPCLKNEVPAWDNFMAKMRKNETPVSDIRALPVIYAPPRYGSVYTALLQARMKCKQGTCVVTLDQPVYQMAQRIVKSIEDNTLNNVVLRLGGFHLMTAFLDAIGRVMAGSGLRELWGSALPAGQAAAALAGTDYATTVRAHLLTRSALFGIITKDFDLTAEERLTIKEIVAGGNFDTSQADNQFRKYQEPLAITLELLEKRGPTAKLWVQYFRMSTLAARLAEAERGADWALHLSTLAHMLPYLLAAGNMEYAKSCSLYLQEMRALETKMSAEEYEAFTKKGYFTIRRSDKSWADVWTDRIAESTMKDMVKRRTDAIGGGRITDSVSTRWSSAGPSLSTVSDLIEGFCNPEPNATTDESSRNKDDEDIKQIRSWFEEHNPFVNTETIVSLGSGILAKGDNINCHNAEEVGKQIMREKVGLNYKDVEYQMDKCVQPLSSVKSTIQIDNFKVPVEPDTILRRLRTERRKHHNEFRAYFEFELAPYPLSLFDEHGMLEPDKPALFDLFVPVEIAEGGRRAHVIDGEFLLHKIIWKDGEPILSIVNTYSEYVKMQFPNAIVVFGYPSNKGIPKMERRKIRTNTATVKLQKNTVIRTSQESFLSNEKNKEKFIEYLIIDFTRVGIYVKFSPDDVPSHVVKTAVEYASKYEETCVVSDNVDLLVIMCARTDQKNIYFMKPGADKPATFYHVHSFRSIKIQHTILFIHAISGCDTTSAIFRKGKAEVASAMESFRSLHIKELMTLFKNPKVEPQDLADYGEWFIGRLYHCVIYTLAERRYSTFIDTWTRSRYDLACLPPSGDACKQHVFRAYHQVQKWLGNDLPATDWGWELVGDHLEPIMIAGAVVPKEVLDMVSCKCKSLCGMLCPCKLDRLDCCELCLGCRGNACHGVDMVADIEPGFEVLSGCDNYGNPINYEADCKDEAEDKADESSVGPSSPKRSRQDPATEEHASEEQMSI